MIPVRIPIPSRRHPCTSPPADARQIIIGGPSGYRSPHMHHMETGHYDANCGRTNSTMAWRTDSGDAYTESWPTPSWWAEIEFDKDDAP